MIRPVALSDAQAIAAIYNPFVLGSTATFEEVEIRPEEMAHRIETVVAAHPWLVFEADGRVVGYAYATTWKLRSAYRYTVESAIYVDPTRARRGIATQLYSRLLSDLKDQGVHAVLAGITLPNEASVALHERLGFEKVGQLKEVGWKFDRWVDVGYWEKRL